MSDNFHIWITCVSVSVTFFSLVVLLLVCLMNFY